MFSLRSILCIQRSVCPIDHTLMDFSSLRPRCKGCVMSFYVVDFVFILFLARLLYINRSTGELKPHCNGADLFFLVVRQGSYDSQEFGLDGTQFLSGSVSLIDHLKAVWTPLVTFLFTLYSQPCD